MCAYWAVLITRLAAAISWMLISLAGRIVGLTYRHDTIKDKLPWTFAFLTIWTTPFVLPVKVNFGSFVTEIANSFSRQIPQSDFGRLSAYLLTSLIHFFGLDIAKVHLRTCKSECSHSAKFAFFIMPIWRKSQNVFAQLEKNSIADISDWLKEISSNEIMNLNQEQIEFFANCATVLD